MSKKHLQLIAFIVILALQLSTYSIVAQELTSVMSKNEISCAGMNDGYAKVSASGGIPPYSYKWSNGEETTFINNIGPGIHTVTVSDSKGSTSLNAINLVEVMPMTLKLEPEDGTCGNLGKITAKLSGGLGPFQYSWSNGSFNAQIRDLEAGTYSLKVTDRGNCPMVESAAVINHGDGLMLDSNFDIPTCIGESNGQISVSQSGGAMPIKYLWNNGATGTSLQNITAGTYSVFATDALGCTDGIVFILANPDTLKVEIINQSNSLFAKVDGGSPSYDYVWSNGAIGTTVISNLSAGTYGLTVEDSNGCSATDEYDIVGPLSAESIDGLQFFTFKSNVIEDELQIELSLDFSQTISFQVYHQSGALILSQSEVGNSFSTSLLLDHEVPSGMSYIRISSSEGWSFVEKFVKL